MAAPRADCAVYRPIRLCSGCSTTHSRAVPDYAAVLVTGDLVQDDVSGYLRFRSIFGNLKKPVLCVPGNHDEPEAMRKELERRRSSFADRTKSTAGSSSCSTATIRTRRRTSDAR